MTILNARDFASPMALIADMQQNPTELPFKITVGNSTFHVRTEDARAIFTLGALFACDEHWQRRKEEG